MVKYKFFFFRHNANVGGIQFQNNVELNDFTMISAPKKKKEREGKKIQNSLKTQIHNCTQPVTRTSTTKRDKIVFKCKDFSLQLETGQECQKKKSFNFYLLLLQNVI